MYIGILAFGLAGVVMAMVLRRLWIGLVRGYLPCPLDAEGDCYPGIPSAPPAASHALARRVTRRTAFPSRAWGMHRNRKRRTGAARHGTSGTAGERS